MITLTSILIILAAHTIFDWILQTRWQAENKSKNWQALLNHCFTYFIGLCIAAMIIFYPHTNPYIASCWAVLNGVLHFITDAITSRLNAKFYPRKSFWNCIGVDQFIHYATLFVTFNLMK
jgi:Protein of unknown function (DUF3307)